MESSDAARSARAAARAQPSEASDWESAISFPDDDDEATLADLVNPKQMWCPGDNGTMVRCTVLRTRLLARITARALNRHQNLKAGVNLRWAQVTFSDEFVPDGEVPQKRDVLEAQLVRGLDMRGELNSFATADGEWVQGVMVFPAADGVWVPCILLNMTRAKSKSLRMDVRLLGGAGSAMYTKETLNGVEAREIKPVTAHRQPFTRVAGEGAAAATRASLAPAKKAEAARTAAAGPSPSLGPPENFVLDAESTGELLNMGDAMCMQRDVQALVRRRKSKSEGMRVKETQILTKRRQAHEAIASKLAELKSAEEVPVRLAMEAAEAKFKLLLRSVGYEYYFEDLALSGINSVERLGFASLRMIMDAINERHPLEAFTDSV